MGHEVYYRKKVVKKIMRTNHKPSRRLMNYMEQLTGDLLSDLLPEYKKVRLSPNSIQDIKALALNRLWPMYVTTDSGKDFIKKIIVEDQIERDVVRELRAAIELVRSHPRA